VSGRKVSKTMKMPNNQRKMFEGFGTTQHDDGSQLLIILSAVNFRDMPIVSI
jgi:hypothetical protein